MREPGDDTELLEEGRAGLPSDGQNRGGTAAAGDTKSMSSAVPTGPFIKVWAYEVPAETMNVKPGEERKALFELSMPRDARILCARVVGARVGIYALVNPQMKYQQRFFYAAGTNQPLPRPEPQGKNAWKALDYVDTFFAMGKSWHLFEVMR